MCDALAHAEVLAISNQFAESNQSMHVQSYELRQNLAAPWVTLLVVIVWMANYQSLCKYPEGTRLADLCMANSTIH